MKIKSKKFNIVITVHIYLHIHASLPIAFSVCTFCITVVSDLHHRCTTYNRIKVTAGNSITGSILKGYDDEIMNSI